MFCYGLIGIVGSNIRIDRHSGITEYAIIGCIIISSNCKCNFL